MREQMKIILIGILMIVSICEVWAEEATETPDEIKQEIRIVLDNFKSMFEQNFKVKIKCEEISDIFTKEIVKKLPGIPIRLTHFILNHKDGNITIKAKLSSLPPALQEMAEQNVSAIVQASSVGQLTQGMVCDSVEKAIEFLLAQKRLSVLKETDIILDVSLDNVNEPFFDGHVLKSIQLRIDREKKVLNIVKLYFQDKEYLTATMTYKLLKIPGREKELYMQSKSIVLHNGLLEESKVKLPKKITLQYEDYKFE